MNDLLNNESSWVEKDSTRILLCVTVNSKSTIKASKMYLKLKSQVSLWVTQLFLSRESARSWRHNRQQILADASFFDSSNLLRQYPLGKNEKLYGTGVDSYATQIFHKWIDYRDIMEACNFLVSLPNSFPFMVKIYFDRPKLDWIDICISGTDTHYITSFLGA